MSTETENAVREEMQKIAPDIDMVDVDKQEDIREEFDIDSMDFLALVTALSKRYKIAMPESDYPRMGTVDDLVAYLDTSIAG